MFSAVMNIVRVEIVLLYVVAHCMKNILVGSQRSDTISFFANTPIFR